MAAGAWAGTHSDALTFEGFTSGVGAMLMGRRTFDVVSAMEGPWPYRDMPIIVATTRPLTDAPTTVAPHSDDIAVLLRRAQELAGVKDVYVDGGDLVRQALAAGILDELIVTVVPVALGSGIGLFAGLDHPHLMTVRNVAKDEQGLVQMTLTAA